MVMSVRVSRQGIQGKTSSVAQTRTVFCTTTFAVQSLNVALESSPLEANAVGQLLPGVTTKQLHAFFPGIKHFLVLL